MDAIVIVKCRIPNCGDEKEAREMGFKSFDESVRWLIDEEGLVGLAEDFEVIHVKAERETQTLPLIDLLQASIEQVEQQKKKTLTRG